MPLVGWRGVRSQRNVSRPISLCLSLCLVRRGAAAETILFPILPGCYLSGRCCSQRTRPPVPESEASRLDLLPSRTGGIRFLDLGFFPHGVTGQYLKHQNERGPSLLLSLKNDGVSGSARNINDRPSCQGISRISTDGSDLLDSPLAWC